MSQPRHYVLYIPGLGDIYDSGRKWALSSWKLYGVRAELVRMNWDGEKAYRPKYDRVVAALRRARADGYLVSLVADSAGAPVALDVLAHFPDDIHHVVTICGVTSPDIPLRDTLALKDPAFGVAVKKLRTVLKKVNYRRITTLQSRLDLVVHDDYSTIKGVPNRRLLAVGHMVTISLCLTLYSGYVRRLIKQA